MDVREKLVELIAQKVCETWSGTCDQWLPHDCGKCYANDCHISEIADYLISNGVTVQEWISVKERIPQENEPDGTLCETVQVLLNNGKASVGWCNRRTKLWWHMDYDKDYFISKDYDHTPVIAWQPLAQPPKGE